MLARAFTLTLVGLDVIEVAVEVDLAPGLPLFEVVGLPDTSVRESRERVRASLRNSGFNIPPRRTIVNLAPANLRKVGPAFDLPIALAILAAAALIPPEALARAYFAGELALDGSLRRMPGALCLAGAPLLTGGNSSRLLVLPAANRDELSFAPHANTRIAATLRDVVAWLQGDNTLPTVRSSQVALAPLSPQPDLADVCGQESARRALEIAAAGRHNLMLLGPPGAGKSMLALRLPGILPPLDAEAMLEVARIHSAAALEGVAIPITRPFRAPHHTSTSRALVGGGAPPKPGEVTMAHHGVLFLDELPEFDQEALAALREPLERYEVTLARALGTIRYPADTQLVAAANPCPCGWLGDSVRRCLCTDGELSRYKRRLTGPILDRIDICVAMPAANINHAFSSPQPAESSATVQARVAAAWQRQKERCAKAISLESLPAGAWANSRLPFAVLKEFCALPPAASDALSTAAEKFGLSARGAERVLRVARTVADLEGSRDILAGHVLEALSYGHGPDQIGRHSSAHLH